ncbi:CopD family protein [Brachybacterium hainanense]|uniref:CopD family protein n=1 Tax=Brachybacterium hainanense TaxID=1541174 RepID=A0ABV6RAG1_9MICO
MSAPSRPVPPRPALILGVVLAIGLLCALSAVTASRAAGANIVLVDAGVLARYGAPAAAVVADLSAALALGGSLIGGWIVRGDAARARALLVAAICAGVWTVSQSLALGFSYAIATGQPLGSERFGSDAAVFLGTDLGVWLIAGVAIAALTTSVALLGSSRPLARTVAVLTAAGLFAKAMTGHASGDANHEVATSTMLVHLLAMGMWIGALAVLQLLPADEERDSAAVIRRFSHLALIAWTALLLSGVWALAVRMTGPGDLLTSMYVQIGVAKAVLLGLLGLFGLRQRRVLADRVRADAAAPAAALRRGGERDGAERAGIAEYRRLAVIELGLMGLAVALAAAMSSSPPPAQDAPPLTSPAGILSGYPLPGAPTVPTLLATWRPDAFALAAAAALLLIWWRPSGPVRPMRSTRLLLGACAAMVLITSSAVAVYAKVLFSAHLLEHVLLLLLVGPPLGALLTLPETLRSRWAPVPGAQPSWPRVLVTAGLGTAPLLVLAGIYATPRLLRPALEGHAPHLMLLLLATIAGAAPVLALRLISGGGAPAGAGPVASPVPDRGRALLILGLPPMVLIIGGSLLAVGGDLILASWFGAMGRTWRTDALADQHQGGAIAAALGVLALAGTVIATRRRRPVLS